MAALKEGDRAPDFSLLADDGQTISLGAFRGKHVVLYFYPKDMTPGCTLEACSFRDHYAAIRRAGAEILGVSFDSTDRHRKFKEQQKLPFPLLTDSKKETATAYGVHKRKSLYGRLFKGIERTTFLIDAEGKIKKIFPKVKVKGHSEEVLAALR
ncbi:MAG TPA: thioredoxin-dependent thiol peroxidase [Candidatus Acidoferrales bacterium]